MIIDYQIAPVTAALFRVIDVERNEPINEPLFYADDVKAIYRSHDRDDKGCAFLVHPETKEKPVKPVGGESHYWVFADGSVGPVKIATTEYYLPIRIEPRPDLTDVERQQADNYVSLWIKD